MKKTTILITFLLYGFSIWAQTGIPVSISYFSPFGFQPGVKIGTSIVLENRQFEKPNSSQSISWIATPQLGYYNRIGHHSNFLTQIDIGRKQRKKGKSKYYMPSIGIGYLYSKETLSNKINLGSGESSKGEIQRNGFFLPTVSYEWGRDIFEKMGWHIKLTCGRKISTKLEDAAFIALEFGLKFSL